MAETLMPCPFCGGKAKVSQIGGFWYRAMCKDARCIAGRPAKRYETPAEAAEAWNRRAERTCHDLGGEDGTNYECYDFGCSACGYCCDLPDPDYCPGCGARVVKEVDADGD